MQETIIELGVPLRGYEQVISALTEGGVEVIFGLMGGGNLRLVSGIEADDDFRYVATRHEATAVNMADGYATSTGRVGVATVTHGPGLTNAVTALTTAARSHSPVLLIVGDVTESRADNAQYINQKALIEPTGAAFITLDSTHSWAEGCTRALKVAAEERRPVVLALPLHLQDSQALLDATQLPGTTLRGTPRKLQDREIDAAIDLLVKSSRVAVLAGRGAVWSNARGPLQELADRLGAILVTSLLAKGFFAGHPYDVGLAGGYGTPWARSVLAEADCILAFGASLNRWTLREGTLFPGARIIQCDIADSAFERSYRAADVIVNGDARTIALALNKKFGKNDTSPNGARSKWRRILEQRVYAKEYDDLGNTVALDPRTAIIRLDHLLPKERSLTVDGGHSAGFPAMYMSVPDPSGFHFTAEFGSIGMSLATAMGAAIGRPDRLSVAAIGDGAFMMTLGEVETAVRARVRVVVVVINDGGYGAEIHKLRSLGLPLGSSLFKNPDFAAVARSLGALGFTVRTAQDLNRLPKLLGELDRPLVIDLRVTRSVMGAWYETAF